MDIFNLHWNVHRDNHKFLVGGHSFLNCDRDFAVIEKRKRLTKCNVPEDLKSMIESVKLTNPFKVA